MSELVTWVADVPRLQALLAFLCALIWFHGTLSCDEDFHKSKGEPLSSSHMLDFSEKSHTENLSMCRQCLERIAQINLIVEMEIGVSGGVEDGVDNSAHKLQ